MAEKPYRFLFRMPEQLRQRLVASAEEHGRSLNSELLSRLERSLEADAKAGWRDRVAALAARSARALPGARRAGYARPSGLTVVAIAVGANSWGTAGSPGTAELARSGAAVSAQGPNAVAKWYARAAIERRAPSP